jgi:hypothetical protein
LAVVEGRDDSMGLPWPRSQPGDEIGGGSGSQLGRQPVAAGSRSWGGHDRSGPVCDPENQPAGARCHTVGSLIERVRDPSGLEVRLGGHQVARRGGSRPRLAGQVGQEVRGISEEPSAPAPEHERLDPIEDLEAHGLQSVVEERRVVHIGTGPVLEEQDARRRQPAEEPIPYELSLSERDLVELAHAHDRVVVTQRKTTFDASRSNPGIPLGGQPASSRRVGLEPDEHGCPCREERSELALVGADLEGSSRPGGQGGQDCPPLAVLIVSRARAEGGQPIIAAARVGGREAQLRRLGGRAEGGHVVASRVPVR